MARPLLAIGSSSIWFLSVLNPPTMTTGGIFGHQRQPGAGSRPPRSHCCQPRVTSAPYTPILQGVQWLCMMCCQSLALEHTKAASYWCFLSFWRGHGNIQRSCCFQQAVVQGGCLLKDWKSPSARFESSRQTSLIVCASRCPSYSFPPWTLSLPASTICLTEGRGFHVCLQTYLTPHSHNQTGSSKSLK